MKLSFDVQEELGKYNTPQKLDRVTRLMIAFCDY
jgi:hypothetical protein